MNLAHEGLCVEMKLTIFLKKFPFGAEEILNRK